MKNKTLEQMAGQTILAGFEGTTLPDSLAQEIKDQTIGGVIFFKRNIESYTAVAHLIDEIKSLSPTQDLVIAVDQEGGRVQRLKAPLFRIPTARMLGKKNDLSLTRKTGQLVGQELRALGFTLNFAPILDVDTNPESPVIGDRSYGDNPKQVIAHGIAFARGLKQGGVFPCAKHFPGHGDATVDSHLALPTVNHNIERLQQTEFAPFSAWAQTGLGPIMTAHILFPKIDADFPATTSHKIINDILQNNLNFKGPVLTDDMEMGALAKMGSVPELAKRAILAGAHGVLICRSEKLRHSTRNYLAKEAHSNVEMQQKLKVAQQHMKTLGHAPGADVSLSWIESYEHTKIIQNLETILHTT